MHRPVRVLGASTCVGGGWRWGCLLSAELQVEMRLEWRSTLSRRNGDSHEDDPKWHLVPIDFVSFLDSIQRHFLPAGTFNGIM